MERSGRPGRCPPFGGTARMMDQAYPGRIYDNLKAVYQPDQYLNQGITVARTPRTRSSWWV